MIDQKEQTLYDVLDISPDANPQDIRAAYQRAKAAYRKDSVALYSLMDPEETDRILAKIEEAFQILSSPEKRKEYDRRHGQISDDFNTIGQAPSQGSPTNDGGKIVSIDRVPPMEGGLGDDLLVAPPTDFTQPGFHQSATQKPAPQFQVQEKKAATPSPFDLNDDSDPFSTPSAPSVPSTPLVPVQPKPPNFGQPKATDNVIADDPTLALEITEQVEWRGRFLRKVRESKRVSIEELADYSKISKTYILAIEDEKFDKLPAPVYLRGFVMQICKYLKLPAEKAAQAYLARANQWRIEKEKKI